MPNSRGLTRKNLGNRSPNCRRSHIPPIFRQISCRKHIFIMSVLMSMLLLGTFPQSLYLHGALAQVAPLVTVSANFATFSYGLLSVIVTVENAIPEDNSINIRFYNPDGVLKAERNETLSISDGKGSFHCYCFNVERQYVDKSYRI